MLHNGPANRPHADTDSRRSREDSDLNHGREMCIRDRCKAIALAQRLIGHFGDGALGVIPAAGLDGTFPDGLALVGDDTRRVDFHEGAETRTLLAGTEGIVEAEHPRGQLLDGDAVLGAGVALAEHHRFTANDVDDDKPVCLRQRGFYGIGQTPADRVVAVSYTHLDVYKRQAHG